MQYKPKERALARFRATLKEQGLKVTPQRDAIFEEIIASDSHPTAEQVHASIRKRFPNISFDTVNRTLMTFARIGLIDIVEGYGSPRRFDPNTTVHHHVHCITCGKIIDFHNDAFDALEAPENLRRRFKIISQKVIFNGICRSCQAKKYKHNIKE